jgi:hypothetical protein
MRTKAILANNILMNTHSKGNIDGACRRGNHVGDGAFVGAGKGTAVGAVATGAVATRAVALASRHALCSAAQFSNQEGFPNVSGMSSISGAGEPSRVNQSA